MDFLKKFNRTFLKDIVFVALFVLYVIGPLRYFSTWIHVIWSLPALFILSGVVWTLLENRLSKERVDPRNKAVFITGCDSGFGHELVKRLVSLGYIVYAGCLFPDGKGAHELSKLDKVKVVECDVTKDDSVNSAARFIKDDLADGQVVWGVVANAGISLVGPLEWCSMDDIKNLFEVNVFGVIRTVQAFLPLLRKSRGRVVITSSISGPLSVPHIVPYSMSKAAVMNLAAGMRREIGAHSKIFFSSIQPSFYRTPMVTDCCFSEVEHRYNSLPAEIKAEFSPRYLEKCQKSHEKITQSIAIPNISEPLRCFVHALTSKRPQPTYSPDRLISKLLLHPIINHFPIETMDYFLQYSSEVTTFLQKYL